MNMNRENVRRCLKAFDFKTLFIDELGWDRLRGSREVVVADERYQLEPIAQKRGVEIYLCKPGPNGAIPEYAKRHRIDAELTKLKAEHLIIYIDVKGKTQIWQWMVREKGKARACREQICGPGSSAENLVQALEHIYIPFSNEEAMTLTGVTIALHEAFGLREKVTKRFYDLFKTEHDAFLKFIQGIPDNEIARWYASVMINRLMFLYFIQAKRFLNGNVKYLRSKLDESNGEYYRDFLCPLFFEGFAKREQDRSKELTRRFGKVPYLNGGLFNKHQIEDAHGETIDIPDAAFDRLFAFFDKYNWHLDDRPLAAGDEINPDVLGYIFEKYINQKQMGAYYTKEDITEYISKNTIIPYLLEETRKGCRVAFEGPHSVWSYLQDDVDRYIYDAVRYGVDLPLPPAIVEGIDDASKRGGWNYPATEEYALPTEIWRETVARRQRCEELRSKLGSGDVNQVSELITLNLNIRQFAQDVIERWDGPDLIKATWDVLNGTADRLPMSILDPTCGSGAFLFAALEILEPLYEACLDRMAAFVADADQLGHTRNHTRFREILTDVAKHPNRRYFIYKRIIINNLYGVDIMEEATEICKLRLFLKLAAQVEPDDEKENLGIEPLPDIDFNIRAGNTLVGFATEAQVKAAITGGIQTAMDFEDKWTTFEAKLKAISKMFNEFQQSQTVGSWSSVNSVFMKGLLRERMKPVRDDLDRHLAHQYGKVSKEATATWKKNAEPFHWFIEFYSVMASGGFDVIIGNPPYVEYSKVKAQYSISGFLSEPSGNLYAFVTERAVSLCDKEASRLGFIIPVSSYSTERAASIRQVVYQASTTIWLSHFGVRPAKLFDGADQRTTILITDFGRSAEKNVWSTRYLRWYTEEREHLIDRLEYGGTTAPRYPKTGYEVARDIASKLAGTPIAHYFGTGDYTFYWHRIPQYFIKAIDFIPYFYSDKGGQKRSDDYKPFRTHSQENALILMALLNSNLSYWYWMTQSEGYHFGKADVLSLPLSIEQMDVRLQKTLSGLAADLMNDYRRNLIRRSRNQRNDNVVYDEFTPKHSKSIMDDIDEALAQHYGLSAEELDYILNYDIKYRMGGTELDTETGED